MANIDELRKRAIEMLDNNDDLFVHAIDELHGYSGFYNDIYCYPMEEIETFFDGMILDLLMMLGDDFNPRDDYFYGDYEIESTNYPELLYRERGDSEEVLDELLRYWDAIEIRDAYFTTIVDAIYKGE